MSGIKEMVNNGQSVEFVKLENNQLWYKTQSGFVFPVPLSDTGSGAFMPKDKAILFMRWIKKHLDAAVPVVCDTHRITEPEAASQFIRYQQGALWYKNNAGFEFPVDITESGEVFHTQESDARLHTWMQCHQDSIEAGRQH